MDVQEWKCRQCQHITTARVGRAYIPRYCQNCKGFDSYYPLVATPPTKTSRAGNLTAGYIPDRRRIPLSALKRLARHLLPIGPKGLSKEVSDLLGPFPDIRKSGEVKLMLHGLPGTHKSTTMMRILKDFAGMGLPCLYNSLEMGAESEMLGELASRFDIPDHYPIEAVSVWRIDHLIEMIRENKTRIVVIDTVNNFAGVDQKDISRICREGRCSLFLIGRAVKGSKLPRGPLGLLHDMDISMRLYRGDKEDHLQGFLGVRGAYIVNKHRFDKHTPRTGVLPWCQVDNEIATLGGSE